MRSIRKYKKFNSLKRVYESSIKFLTPLSLEQTYKVFIDEAIKLVDGKYGSILLIKNGRMQRAYSSNSVLEMIKPRYNGYTYKVSTSKVFKILKIKDLEKIHPEIKKANIKYDIIIPLINKNKSIGVFTVLTKHKMTKKQIDLLQLFSPLGTLAIRKAQLYAEINKAIETRDLFISLAAHELRTPITASSMNLQLIERNYLKHKPFDINWVISLKNEIERLSAIINELLELNQIKNGRLSYSWQECKIEEIIERATISFKAKYSNHLVKVKYDLPKRKIVFIGDFNKLIGVFINLLDNAAKHSESRIPIIVNVDLDKKYIIIRVKDKGTGIPKKDIGKIFDDFYKAQGNTKPGMGLGLFLAKQIIKKHKGNIEVESELGKGTSIQIELPILK